jgi:long-chain fatty acid transport protein
MTRHIFQGRVFICWVCAAALAGLLSAEPGHAQTPRIQGQGTAASGMGNAFTAQADDASALHYNPAGATQLRGVQLMTGSLFIGGATMHTSPTGQNTRGDRGGSVAWPPPTHFYLTANLKDIGINALGDTTLGLGVTVPFGSLTEYQETAPFKNSVIFNTLPLLDIKPTIAYKLNDQLSFGLGADIYTFSTLFGEGHLEIKRKLAVAGSPDSEVNGSGTGAGFNVSMMYTPFRNAEGKPLANVGLVFRSQAVVPLSGQFIVNGATVADAKANLVLPQIMTAAVALWPVRDQEREWKLEMDIDYVRWKVFRNTTINLSTPNALGTPAIPVAQNWRDSYNVMIGTEYKFLKIERLPEWEVALRAGYMHLQTQMPDQTYNPGIPSADNHIPSFGVGFTCKENGSFLGLTKCGNLGLGSVKPKSIGLDLSYQLAYYEDRTVTGQVTDSTVGTNAAVNGTYRTTIHAGGVSLRFNF